MVTINLSKAQADNLLNFLARADLKGNEALAMVQLQQIIVAARQPLEEPEK